MKREIIWTERALDDLDEIFTYIAARNERAALELVDQIDQSVLPAAEFPEMFRSGSAEATREIVAHPNYLVIYETTAQQIVVLGVVHASRDYPRTMQR